MPCLDLHLDFPGLDITALAIETDTISVDAELTRIIHGRDKDGLLCRLKA